MKLTKSLLIGGKILQAGTDLANELDIDLSAVPLSATDYTMQTVLNQKIWQGDVLRPEVKDRLLQIANEFYGNTGFAAEIKDIIITGSIANYNYHDGSDIDLHIIIDYKDIDDNIELVRIAANGVKWKWNEQHTISISGHEVETYIQHADEEHTSSGIYSILQDAWHVKPEYNAIVVDTVAVQIKAASFKLQVDALESEVDAGDYDQEDIHERLSTIRYKILRLRRDAFERGEDEFSIGNLCFKELRNTGYIEKIMQLENKIYDERYTLV